MKMCFSYSLYESVFNEKVTKRIIRDNDDDMDPLIGNQPKMTALSYFIYHFCVRGRV